MKILTRGVGAYYLSLTVVCMPMEGREGRRSDCGGASLFPRAVVGFRGIKIAVFNIEMLIRKVMVIYEPIVSKCPWRW